jgi:hypothetical protein
MKRRSQRQQSFESIKDNLYAAGVSTVKAAKAQEEMFTTTLEALSEAYEAAGLNQLSGSAETVDVGAIAAALLTCRQAALAAADYEAYVAAEEKLQRLDELAVLRLERQVRQRVAQQQLDQLSEVQAWTEASLKAQYKTLQAACQALNLKARTWRAAADQANQQTGQ